MVFTYIYSIIIKWLHFVGPKFYIRLSIIKMNTIKVINIKVNSVMLKIDT